MTNLKGLVSRSLSDMFAKYVLGVERVMLGSQWVDTSVGGCDDEVQSTEFPVSAESWQYFPKFDDCSNSNTRTLTRHIHEQQGTDHQDARHEIFENDPAYAEDDDASNSQDVEGAGTYWKL